MKKLVIAALALAMSMGCTSTNEPVIPADAKPIVLKAGMEKRVSQDNEFAFDLLRETIGKSKEANVFISPLSVSIALGMAWNGAAGQTRTEMETALKLSGISPAEINDYYRIMQTSLPGIDPKTKLSLANSLWYRTGFNVKADFLKINTDYFSAYIKELDFEKSWAKDTINNWCARKTNNVIPSVLDQIPSKAVMYLISAVYFKGIWCKKFDPKNTFESNFTNEAGQLVKVNMMHRKDTFSYCSDEYAQYLDMPYGNKAFSMTVILPNEGKNTGDVLQHLSAEKWKNTLGNLVSQEVDVFLPRFKNKNKFTLNEELRAMGMKLAFDGPADFSNIANDDLLISRVLHDTYVEVNEEGTEAAAVTTIEIIKTTLPLYPVFRADKPFIFVIREKSTGVILFIGKMGNIEKY